MIFLRRPTGREPNEVAFMFYCCRPPFALGALISDLRRQPLVPISASSDCDGDGAADDKQNRLSGKWHAPQDEPPPPPFCAAA